MWKLVIKSFKYIFLFQKLNHQIWNTVKILHSFLGRLIYQRVKSNEIMFVLLLIVSNSQCIWNGLICSTLFFICARGPVLLILFSNLCIFIFCLRLNWIITCNLNRIIYFRLQCVSFNHSYIVSLSALWILW